MPPPTSAEINRTIFELLSNRAAAAEGVRPFGVKTMMDLFDAFRGSGHFLTRHMNQKTRQYMFEQTKAVLEGKAARPDEGAYTASVLHLVLSRKGFRVGNAEQEDDDFCDAVYKACLRIVSRGLVPANLEYLQTRPRLWAEYTRAQEEHAENQRYAATKNYQALLAALDSLPSVEVVRAKVGPAEGEQWAARLEGVGGSRAALADDVDVDAALEVGADKSWSAAAAKRSMTLFSLFADNIDRTAEEVDEAYVRWKNGNTQQRIAATSTARAEAAALGVWRVRAVDEPRWRAALAPHEWEEYAQLDDALKKSLRGGVYQFIPRRHLSAESTSDMRATNLPALRALRSVPPQAQAPPP